MKQPGLPIKPTLPIVSGLILAGFLSLLPDPNFSGQAVAADDPNETSFTIEKTAIQKRIADLSKTSLAWRQKLSKHVFTQVDRELHSLEQQFNLHDSAKGKRLVKRVKISLQKMKTGKQKFVSTGRESFLNSFYSGRTVLEYNLWKLKNLSRDLEMDPDQSQALYRVYALMNKWLVYVAHREINARRQGTFDTSPQNARQSTQDIEDSSAELQPIFEVTTITQDDMEEAGKALSVAPSLEQEMSTIIGQETPDFPSIFEEDVDSPEAATLSNWKYVLIMGIGVLIVLFLLFRKKVKLFQMKDPFTNNIYDNGDSDDELITIDDFVTSEHIDYGIPHEDNSTHEYVAHQIEAWTKTSKTEKPIADGETFESIHSLATSNGFGDNTQDNMALQKEIARRQGNTLTNESLDTSQEIKESRENNVEALHDESKEPPQVFINLLKKDHPPTETGEITNEEEPAHNFQNILEENDSLTEKLEILNTEKGEFTQELEHIRAEINSLTETLRASDQEKTDFETQLKSVTAEKEELAQEQDHLRTENISLTKKLEILHQEKEESDRNQQQLRSENDSLFKKLDSTQEEKEEVFRKLEHLRTEHHLLSDKLEAAHKEKVDLETQQQSSIIAKEEFAQKQQHLRMENDSLTKELKFLKKENEVITKELESIRTKSNAVSETLDAANNEKEELKRELKDFRLREKKLTEDLESTLAENRAHSENITASNDENEDLRKQLETLRTEEENFKQERNKILTENNSLTRELEAAYRENIDLTEKQKSTNAKLKTAQKKNKELMSAQENVPDEQEALTKKLKAAQKTIKELEEALKNASLEQEDATKKLKTAQDKIKKVTRKNKELTNQCKLLETENKSTNEPDHEFMAELLAMSAEIKDLKKKLESAYTKTTAKKNQSTALDSQKNNQKHSSPMAGEHEAILEILRSFADINKDLYKIAESRYAPTNKSSRESQS